MEAKLLNLIWDERDNVPVDRICGMLYDATEVIRHYQMGLEGVQNYSRDSIHTLYPAEATDMIEMFVVWLIDNYQATTKFTHHKDLVVDLLMRVNPRCFQPQNAIRIANVLLDTWEDEPTCKWRNVTAHRFIDFGQELQTAITQVYQGDYAELAMDDEDWTPNLGLLRQE